MVTQTSHNADEPLGILPQLFVYLSYGMLFLFGYLRDWIDNILFPSKKTKKEGFAPLTNSFEDFFRRRLYSRIIDIFNRPITGAAAGEINVLKYDFKNKRVIDFAHANKSSLGEYNNKLQIINKNINMDKDTGLMKFPEFNNTDYIKCVNFSSYNYLGFGQPGHPICEPNVLKTIDKYGISMCNSPIYGQSDIQKELENKIASFLNVDDSMVFGMGWGVNSTAIPVLVGKGCLIISDSKNHNSIVVGARTSGAVIRTFKHNDPINLENKIRKYIIEGQPRSHRPWKKILIIIEGVYSMEGSVCKLREIIKIKKRYNCYLYLDEAHSIGACGNTGRGVCELTGVDTKDIDILMGTFTKSFGAIGGYIAGKKELINTIRGICATNLFGTGLSPACQKQVLSVLEILDTKDGRNKIKQLHKVSDYIRKTLRRLGFSTLGEKGTAIIPVLIGLPAKFPVVSRELLKRGFACVVVGFPAVPIGTGRIRLCLSSNHTMDQINKFCDTMSKLGDILKLKYVNRILG